MMGNWKAKKRKDLWKGKICVDRETLLDETEGIPKSDVGIIIRVKNKRE